MPFKDKEAKARSAKRFYEKHKSKIQEYSRSWYLEHREEQIAKAVLRHQLNRDHLNDLNRQRRRKLKREVLSHYGNSKLACVWCGFEDIRALTIDHINGGGRRHKREIGIKTGTRMYAWLKVNNYPDGFQTLCFNCQWIKRDEKHEYYNCLERKEEVFNG